MFRTIILFILLSLPFFSFAQRTLPYPIILVHGWGGDASTWEPFTKYLSQNAGLTIEPLNFWLDLNSDNNNSTSYKFKDVSLYGRGQNVGNHDVYVIDFTHGQTKSVKGNISNQQAVVKQGLGIKFAIEEVLRNSGADKVILLGHSMGGLAAREYLQTPFNWMPDGNHHLGKLITIGTPHRGSNVSVDNLGNTIIANIFGFFKDENSEAVRDLRETYQYADCVRNGIPEKCPGVYLWGGQETRSWMKTNIFGASNFYNIDVDCNGFTGDRVEGLNEKSIRTDLDFSCIIGGPNNDDGIVSTRSQNLNTIYSSLNAELFYFYCYGDPICHLNEPKNALVEMIQALDEPKKYPIQLKFGQQNTGFFTNQENGSSQDFDKYQISVPQKGIISYIANNVLASNGSIIISDPYGKIISNQSINNDSKVILKIEIAGNYTIDISGNSLGSWATYKTSFGFCPLPPDPIVSSTSPITFCENDAVELLTGGGYDSYTWFKDNQNFAINTTKITVSKTGTYSVSGNACGLSFASKNNLQVTVKPLPPKPTLIKEDQPDKFVITANTQEGLEWFFNGVLLPNQKNSILIPDALGEYFVKTSKDGCSTVSEKVIVKMDKPILETVGKNEACVGDSILLKGPLGFSNYVFDNGLEKYSSIKNQRYFNKDGTYSIITQRGKFSSVPSEPQKIVFNPIPDKPKLVFENYIIKSSLASNYQWFYEGKVLVDSIKSTLKPSEFGPYQVQISEKSCLNISDNIIITALEANPDNKIAKIYPNPNDGKVWVEFYEKYLFAEISILDLNGKLLKNEFFYKDIKRIVNLYLTLPPSTYLMVLKTDKNIQRFKLIIR
jgi:pimeloyl-ACP methyl ester carboxylesterase